VSTPSLAITHIAAAQNQKEVTANAAFDALDNADNAEVSFANADADMMLTQAQLASGGCIKITGALTANRHVNLPAISRSFVFVNATSGGHSLIVQVTGAPGATVSISAVLGLVELFSDATNIYALTGGSGGVFSPGGDLGGSSTSQTVVGLEGVPLDATTVGAPAAGSLVAYDSGSAKYKTVILVEDEAVSFSGTSGTLADTPSTVPGFTKVKLHRGGVRMKVGAGNDFTISGATITLATAAGSENFTADYWK
jgi:hypothetical protein